MFHTAAVFAWLAVAFLVFGTTIGIALVLAHGEERRERVEKELKEVERLSGEYGYSSRGQEARLKSLTEQVDAALERDRNDRRQAVANLLFATVFEVVAFGVVGVFVIRPYSPYQSAVFWGSLAGGVLGLIGAVVSQFAPVLGGFLMKRFTVPFAPHQLTLLLEHSLIFGVVGILLGAGVSIVRFRSRPSPPS